jgi:light-regulated signal transduction histidine kinase (bacteriophytochrome)
VHGDSGLWGQVAIKALSNAVNYTRTCALGIIKIGARDERDNEVTVFVRDNGVGFDTRHASQLFRVFQRTHREDKFEGTGIGLANAKRIVTRRPGGSR